MPADLATLENVKEYLGIPDGTDDGLLKRLITAQSAWFYRQISREILTRTYVETLNGNDARIRTMPYMGPWFFMGAGFSIELYDYPVTVFTSLVIDGTPVLAATNIGLPTQTDGWALEDQRRILLTGGGYGFTIGYGFASGTQDVVLTYDAGYGSAVPADIEQAVIELVAWRYREKDRIGQQSRTIGGETVVFSPYAAPQSVLTVLDSYRRVNV